MVLMLMIGVGRDGITIDLVEYEKFIKQHDVIEEFTTLQVAECSLIEQLRYIMYPSGGFIGPHTDGVKVCPQTFRCTKMTMILYLSDSDTGETIFLRGHKSDPVEYCKIKPRKGSMVLFQHHLLHMGDGVGKEGKILLRGDIVV